MESAAVPAAPLHRPAVERISPHLSRPTRENPMSMRLASPSSCLPGDNLTLTIRQTKAARKDPPGFRTRSTVARVYDRAVFGDSRKKRAVIDRAYRQFPNVR